jgi:hypothetical protein
MYRKSLTIVRTSDEPTNLLKTNLAGPCSFYCGACRHYLARTYLTPVMLSETSHKRRAVFSLRAIGLESALWG